MKLTLRHKVLAGLIYSVLCYGLAVEIAQADDDHGCRGNCERDDNGPPIDIDIDAGGGDGGDGYGGEGGEGGQGGEGGDADSDATANANGEQTVIFEGAQTPGRGYVGGGSSSADHQKVRAISGGWLTGMAAIRWDATDKELRSLHRADNLRARGLIEAADMLECSTKVIYKAVGGSREQCVILLTTERELVGTTSARDAEQDAIIHALQLQLATIYEQAIPEAQEQHTQIALEVQRIQQAAPPNATQASEIASLSRAMTEQRDAERSRIESFRMNAQQSLDVIAEAQSKGYVQDTEEQTDDDEF